jgi:hypothetical protein
MFEIYIFTKNGQILLKYFSSSLSFSAQSTIRSNSILPIYFLVKNDITMWRRKS